MVGEIGKEYNIPAYPTRPTNNNFNSWFCSEILWYAYKINGLDIQSYDWTNNSMKCDPGPTPHNLLHYKDARQITKYSK
jgi:uncharacterized protein YycO